MTSTTHPAVPTSRQPVRPDEEEVRAADGRRDTAGPQVPEGMSRRSYALEQRPVNKDGFVREWPQVGLVAMDSHRDPKPGVRVENGRIVEMDGRPRAKFDFIDQFIADRAIDATVTERVMAIPVVEIAHMLVDPKISRKEVLGVTRGLTPAKLLEVVKTMNVVEMMMAFQKMRARRTPSNQAHTTSAKENPVQVAADAAEAALRGFSELETTLGILKYAPLVAIALQIGAQTGRGGVLTQCALEESATLKLGLRGLTGYAETVSVYGTEEVFYDGDDTPWSKAFLASAYASRGIKIRFTSGTGSEVLMGHSEGKSMLYLEIRCILVTKAAGVQGLQNGSVSCIGLPGAVPGGLRAVMAENLICSMVDLECAAGNDQAFSHSKMRATARFLPHLLAGADLVCGGYSSVPNSDNMFAGSNLDAEDYDDWNAIQRDMQVDGGIRHVKDEEILAIRERAARALKAAFDNLDLPVPVNITEEEIQCAKYAHGSGDMPPRDVAADLAAAEGIEERKVTGLDLVKALQNSDDEELRQVGCNLLKALRQRVSGDLLQTSAMLDGDAEMTPRSAVNDPNDYAGPATGYRPTGERWEQLKELRHVIETHPHRDVCRGADDDAQDKCDTDLLEQARQRVGWTDKGQEKPAKRGSDPNEVVVGLSPGFGLFEGRTITKRCDLADVLAALIEGITARGGKPRFVRCLRSADVAVIAHDAAKLSGSGIGIGVLTRGTTVIHSADLPRLSNLELFPQAPVMDTGVFRMVGENAARYANRDDTVLPVPTRNDYMARVAYQAKAALSQIREMWFVQPSKPAVELEFSLDGKNWRELVGKRGAARAR